MNVLVNYRAAGERRVEIRYGGREEGRKGGREEGRKGGREEGRKGGREEGRKGGREEGRKGMTGGENRFARRVRVYCWSHLPARCWRQADVGPVRKHSHQGPSRQGPHDS